MSTLILITLNAPIFAPDGKEYRAVLVDNRTIVKGQVDVSFGRLVITKDAIRATLIVSDTPRANNIYDAR